MAKLIKKREYKGLDYFLFECKMELFTYYRGTSIPELFTIVMGVDVIGKKNKEKVYTNRYPNCELVFI